MKLEIVKEDGHKMEVMVFWHHSLSFPKVRIKKLKVEEKTLLAVSPITNAKKHYKRFSKAFIQLNDKIYGGVAFVNPIDNADKACGRLVALGKAFQVSKLPRATCLAIATAIVKKGVKLYMVTDDGERIPGIPFLKDLLIEETRLGGIEVLDDSYTQAIQSYKDNDITPKKIS
jgi:hypothetical protein